MKHTLEPWGAYRQQEHSGRSIGWRVEQRSTERDICHIYEPAEANARRIVACVNACVGISTENLEGLKDGLDSHSVVVFNLVADFKKSENQRDNLLALLKDILSDEMGFEHIRQDLQNRIIDTIARINGGK